MLLIPQLDIKGPSILLDRIEIGQLEVELTRYIMNACIVIVLVVRNKFDFDKANSHPMRKVRTMSALSHPNELCACSSSKLTAAENCMANTTACNGLGGSKPACIGWC